MYYLYRWKGGRARSTERMRQLRDDGLSYTAIGKPYGLSRQRVHQILGSDGKHYPKIIQIDKKWLQAQIEIKGRWCSEIADELGVSPTLVGLRKNHYGFKRKIILNPGEWPTEPATKGAKGYLFVWSPFHPHTNSTGKILQHRLVAEKYLRRYLRPGRSGETSHHIDEDRTNNKPNNLCVFENVGYHTAFHRWLRGECKVVDESHVIWVVPESRERMIEFCGWPNLIP